MKTPTGKPCRECPFKRASAPGYLGNSNAQELIDTVMADTPMPCHMTVDYESRDWEENMETATYCSGTLIFFSNTCKKSRDPERPTLPRNTEMVFHWAHEFINHHKMENTDANS